MKSSVYFCFLLLGTTVYNSEQQSLQLLMNPRNGNRINLTCITGQFRADQIDFYLNQINVNEIQTELRLSRINENSNVSITIEIGPRNEGFIFCGICSSSSLCSVMSGVVGPIAADPEFSENGSVALFYVGEVNSSVTLFPTVPLGSLAHLYSYTWRNGTSFNVDTNPRYHINSHDRSLTVNSLQVSDAGRFSLRVEINVTPRFTYTNNSYQLHVQELPTASIREPTILKIKRSAGDLQSQLITCHAQGYPNLSIQWLHNNRDVSARSDKYLVSQQVTRESTLTGTLHITSLSARDNGLVSCIASIRGCNPQTSRERCNTQTYSSKSSTTSLSILTGEFQYSVLVLAKQNLELRMILNGNPIPVPVYVFINYSEEGTSSESVVRSQGTFSNISHINLYIPAHTTPAFNRFKVKIALGIDANNTGPFVAPVKDIVYDINTPDDVCGTQKILIVVIPCTLGAILVTIIIAISLMVINKQRLINRLKIEASEIAKQFIDPNEKADAKMEQYQKFFPLACRTMMDGTEDDPEHSDDSDNSHKERGSPADNSSSRIEADSKTICRPKKISAEWIEATDKVLCLVRDRNKQLQLMHYLSIAVNEQQTKGPLTM